MLSIGLCAQAACILEATARKPGNVHPECDFDNLTYVDFLLSAAAIGPVFDAAASRSVGATILEAIRATRDVVKTNTNLGIVLLLAPLAAVARENELRSGVADVLKHLTVEDARLAYEAIRLAVPGALGKVESEDVSTEPTQTLLDVMKLAAERDGIARQYATGFRDIFDDGLPALTSALERLGSLEAAIIHCHLTWMAKHPDTLIARKRGQAEAEESAVRARQVLDAGWPMTEAARAALADLDRWLRELGSQRNPGTTADLVTACLFAALRDDTITLPGHLTPDS
jgi:triphosphoribosyl-dephospho-CoA synthase